MLTFIKHKYDLIKVKKLVDLIVNAIEEMYWRVYDGKCK